MDEVKSTNIGGNPVEKFKTLAYGIDHKDMREKEIVDGFGRMEYGIEKPERIIEIKIIRRKHKEEDYLEGKDKFPKPFDDYHYYIFYANSEDGKPKKLKELNEELGQNYCFNGKNNFVNSTVHPGQKVKWICLYPFTIYYGGTSIITTDEHGFPRPRQIIPYLKARRIDLKDEKNESGQNFYYETPDAWIVYNALSGAYKYFVSVYIPKNDAGGGDIICVDDPQDHVPPPG